MAGQRKIVRWGDPSPLAIDPTVAALKGGSRGSRWEEIAAALRDDPGRWAVVLVAGRGQVSSIATKIRSGHTKCFGPPGSFEVTRRKVGGTFGTTELFVRYVGVALG